jgi:nucleolar MIF4G domain-containing protein 1
MGETSASGQGELREEVSEGGGKKVEKKRVRNVARAYAWWIAKGGLSLMVLKVSWEPDPPGDDDDEIRADEFSLFKVLSLRTIKPQTGTFVSQLLSDIVLSTQSSSPLLAATITTARVPPAAKRDAEPIERAFVKVAAHESLCKGLRWYIQNRMSVAADDDEEEGQDGGGGGGRGDDDLLRWGLLVARKTLKAGQSLVERGRIPLPS